LSNTDAVVVGSGPNGLAAAVVLARAGLSVQVFEARETPGGGCRSEGLTLPGFVHDVCATVFATAVVSPFLRELPLPAHGVRWVHPPVSLAHPFRDGPPAVVAPGLDRTIESLGRDGPAYRRLVEPLLEDAEVLWPEILAPAHWPRRPLALARFGLRAVRSAEGLARAAFEGDRAQALFAGMAAHGFLPLSKPLTAALALVLAISGHSPGWPDAEGGAQRLTDALVRIAEGLGVSFVTGHRVDRIEELPSARAYLLDVAPRHLAEIAGARLASRYCDRLRRYRYGARAFKIDWALSDPIPVTRSWRAACAPRPRWSATTRTTSAVTSSEGSRTFGSSSPGRWPASCPTPRRTRLSSSARRRRRRARGCTACAATTPQRRRSPVDSADQPDGESESRPTRRPGVLLGSRAIVEPSSSSGPPSPATKSQAVRSARVFDFT
jgi:phytoene dehydrogenase-like protein